MKRQQNQLFGIGTIGEYLAFCAEAVAECDARQGNILCAFSAILALNHVHDWLQYKLTTEQRHALSLTGTKVGDPVKDVFESRNADIKLIREIANGFKHLRLEHATEKVGGFGQGPYGVGPYGASYLLVDLGENLPSGERWVVALDLCKRVLDWWSAELSKIPTNTEKNQND
jgi:hypothetical protein